MLRSLSHAWLVVTGLCFTGLSDVGLPICGAQDLSVASAERSGQLTGSPGPAATRAESAVATRGARLETPDAEYVVRAAIPYVRRGETTLALDAYLPQGPGPFPAVMLVHGGAWRIGTRWQMGHHAAALAKRGYATFSISYRLAPQHPFPAQLDDCRSALCWIRQNAGKYGVDSQRIGAAGYSAGGHLVALLAATGQPPAEATGGIDTRLQAVVAGGAPCEFRELPEDSRLLAYWLGGSRRECAETYRLASPTAHVTAAAPPMLFYRGAADTVVPEQWTRPMYESLKRCGVETEYHQIDGVGHLTTLLTPEAIRRTSDFLDRHLRR